MGQESKNISNLLFDCINNSGSTEAINFIRTLIDDQYVFQDLTSARKLKLIQFLITHYEILLALKIYEQINFADTEDDLQLQWTQLGQTLSLYSPGSLKKFETIAYQFHNRSKNLIYPQIVEKIQLAITNKKGFSFVRLGDGEGNILGLQLSDLLDMSRRHANEISQLQFGKGVLSQADQELLSAYLMDSMRSVDVLGIMSPLSLLRRIETHELPFARQLAGNIMNYRVLYEKFNAQFNDFEYIDSAINYDPYWENEVLQIALNSACIGIVGPHPEAVDYFKDRQIDDVLYFNIPGERKYFPGEASHFHDVFPAIVSALSGQDFSGRVFLVGGGLLGKYYCHLIKACGGVALDIGSTMDRICGHSFTRAS
jgi:hypothetical protein